MGFWGFGAHKKIAKWNRINIHGRLDYRVLEIPYIVVSNKITNIEKNPASKIFPFPMKTTSTFITITRASETVSAAKMAGSIIAAACGALLLLGLLVIVLWRAGFFKRKKRPGMEDVNK